MANPLLSDVGNWTVDGYFEAVNVRDPVKGACTVTADGDTVIWKYEVLEQVGEKELSMDLVNTCKNFDEDTQGFEIEAKMVGVTFKGAGKIFPDCIVYWTSKKHWGSAHTITWHLSDDEYKTMRTYIGEDGAVKCYFMHCTRA